MGVGERFMPACYWYRKPISMHASIELDNTIYVAINTYNYALMCSIIMGCYSTIAVANTKSLKKAGGRYKGTKECVLDLCQFAT